MDGLDMGESIHIRIPNTNKQRIPIEKISANSETRCGRCTSAESFTIAAASQGHKIARIITSHTFDVRTRRTGMHGFKRRTTDARDCKGARRDDVQCAAGTDARVVNECLFQGVAGHTHAHTRRI